MSINVNGIKADGIIEACKRLRISRASLLRYIDSGFFTQPKRHLLGRTIRARYFDEAWYRVNERRLREAQRRLKDE